MASSNTSGTTFTAQALSALPPEIRGLITNPGKTSERIQAALRWASRPDPSVVRRHRRRNPAIRSFADIERALLGDMDAVAVQVARQFRRRAAATGAISGLPGGLWAVVAAGADVQLTAIYAVRMVSDIAQSYGYDTGIVEEQAQVADVLAVAAGVDSLRGVGNWLSREGLTHLLPEVLPRLLMRLSVKITQEQAAKWVGRLIPGVGAAIGGAIDYTFLRIAGNRAIEHYHNRYVNEHALPGGAAPALPAPSDAEEVAERRAQDADDAAEAAEMRSAPPAAAGVAPAISSPAISPSAAADAALAAPIAYPAPAGAARSGALAAVLEILIPGAGALYAGHGAVGALWFLVSLLGLYIANLAAGDPAGTLVQGKGGVITLPDWLLYFGILAGAWLVARIAFAARYARTYHVRHDLRRPDRLGAAVATWALIVFVATLGACAALGYLAYSGIASLVAR